MTHTPWQAGTTIAQDFTLRRALSQGADLEPWLADGPDASASYIVHRLIASIATSEEASRIAALRQSLSTENHAAFEAFIDGSSSEAPLLIERIDEPAVAIATPEDIACDPARLEQLIHGLAQAENLGLAITALTSSQLLTHSGTLVSLRTGWPAAWFDAKRSVPISRVDDFANWLIHPIDPNGSSSESSASAIDTIIQPVLDGVVRDFSDWADAIAQSNVVRNASIESGSAISANEPATVIIQSAQQSSSDSRPSQPYFWMALILILASGFVFFVLPEWVASNRDQPSTVVPKAAETPAPLVAERASPLAAAQNKLDLEKAEALAEDFLRRLLALEDKGLRFWNSPALERLNNAAIAADDAFRRTEGETSLSAYEALLVELTSLEASIPSVIENYEQEAGAVMATGNYTRAQEVYRTLSLLVPDNPSYPDSLERAEQLPDVTLILSEVDQIIVDGKLDDARDRLKDALALVPDWPASLATQSRIETAIGRRDFQATMTQGFAALAAGEFESARALFKKAEASPFDNGDAEEGLRQIASRETNQTVDRLRQDGEIALENGAWQTAIDLLRELAALTPRSVAVQAQLSMAEERLALENEGQAYLDDPLSLQSDEQLQRARAWVVNVSRLSPPKGQMSTQLIALGRLLSLARSRHDVTLTSDGMTSVKLLRAGDNGALGALERTTLQLIPGRYTVTGRRAGFIDVRTDFEVPPDGEIIQIDVRCEERVP
jgi:hypothetical protein